MAMNRTSFISSLGAAAAVAFLRDVALADEGGSAFGLTPLVETIMPVTSSGFPTVTGQEITGRIESLYHLSGSQTFVASLTAFMQPKSFATPSALLYRAERSIFPDVDVHEAVKADAEAYRSASLPSTSDFASFKPDERAAYVRLWSQSAFSTRRRFYQSIRFVTFAAFYSMPQAWSTIGYAGPLLSKAL